MSIRLSRLCLDLRLVPHFKWEACSPGSVGVEQQRNQESRWIRTVLENSREAELLLTSGLPKLGPLGDR